MEEEDDIYLISHRDLITKPNSAQQIVSTRRMMSKVWAATLTCLLLVTLCNGMIHDDEVSWGEDNKFDIMWYFSFGEGGRFDYQVELSNDPNEAASHTKGSSLQLMVCTTAEVEVLRELTRNEACSERRFKWVG